jgi:hypothetical protein
MASNAMPSWNSASPCVLQSHYRSTWRVPSVKHVVQAHTAFRLLLLHWPVRALLHSRMSLPRRAASAQPCTPPDTRMWRASNVDLQTLLRHSDDSLSGLRSTSFRQCASTTYAHQRQISTSLISPPRPPSHPTRAACHTSSVAMLASRAKQSMALDRLVIVRSTLSRVPTTNQV